MFQGVYKFANHCICLKSIYEQVQLLCADYRTAEPAEATLSITPEDIDFEREAARLEHEKEGLPPADFTPEYLETTAVYRKMANLMLQWDVLLFHGSAVAVDGKCYLFAAKSGTGKSTHTRLWRKTFGERAFMVNDDKPLLHITEKGVQLFGTPWDGKHHLSRNTSCPLQALCFLERGETNRIKKADPSQMIKRLLTQSFIPKDFQLRLKALALLDTLCKQVPFYELHCNMDPEAAVVAYRGMAPQKIEDLLRFDGMLIHGIKGVSMRPLLHQDRDMAIIVPATEAHLHDVVLFKRDNGQYVLHRVTRVVRGEHMSGECVSYEITGDNCVYPERVEPRQLLGVMTHFVRKGVKHSVSDPWYKCYVRIWSFTPRIRTLFNFLFRVANKVWK